MGGGILNAGSLSIESGTVIEDNTAAAGAGIYNFGGSLQIDGAVISGNVAGSGGGAIYNTSGGSVAITASTLSANQAAYGGGIYLRGGSVTLLDTSIANNTATFEGGGMMNIGGSVKIAGGSVTDNLADGTGSTSGGGAFYNQVNYSSSSAGGTLTITGTTISANRAVSGGGGIFVYSGALTLNYATLAGNSAGGDGGGIYNYNPADQAFSANSTATATLLGVTFSGNTASIGGAIENDDTLSFTNTTIADNSATNGAGIDNAGTLTAVNATIAYNTVTTGGSGGGLNVEPGGDAILFNSIIALNTVNGGSADDIAGTADSASSYNLIGQGGSGGLVDSQGNQVGVDSTSLLSVCWAITAARPRRFRCKPAASPSTPAPIRSSASRSPRSISAVPCGARPGSTPGPPWILVPTRRARRTWYPPPPTPTRSAPCAPRSAGPTSARTPIPNKSPTRCRTPSSSPRR